eukprot:TRINITY_DN4770_c0_g1_i1.p1 TRINITY_DN4770_c0_g1~~TRINITY_DN4770_c0_g1_i1.p1  ORF type:complete len:138 (+),score=14.53 TRINITY_DN4770_c0_g1_i1:253-666(+)
MNSSTSVFLLFAVLIAITTISAVPGCRTVRTINAEWFVPMQQPRYFCVSDTEGTMANVTFSVSTANDDGFLVGVAAQQGECSTSPDFKFGPPVNGYIRGEISFSIPQNSSVDAIFICITPRARECELRPNVTICTYY